MELQETRRHILDIMRESEQATVEEIVAGLTQRLQRSITTVTVRHHLEKLREEGLVNAPEVLRRSSPGRPQYAYSLTDKAYEYFPNNYAGFAGNLLVQLKQHLPPQEVNVILQDMAQTMAYTAGVPSGDAISERVSHLVAYLNDQGYTATCEPTNGGYLLTTCNCPYERIAGKHEELCEFDLRLVSSMLGVVPRFVGTLRGGQASCQYFIPIS